MKSTKLLVFGFVLFAVMSTAVYGQNLIFHCPFSDTNLSDNIEEVAVPTGIPSINGVYSSGPDFPNLWEADTEGGDRGVRINNNYSGNQDSHIAFNLNDLPGDDTIGEKGTLELVIKLPEEPDWSAVKNNMQTILDNMSANSHPAQEGGWHIVWDWSGNSADQRILINYLSGNTSHVHFIDCGVNGLNWQAGETHTITILWDKDKDIDGNGNDYVIYFDNQWVAGSVLQATFNKYYFDELWVGDSHHNYSAYAHSHIFVKDLKIYDDILTFTPPEVFISGDILYHDEFDTFNNDAWYVEIGNPSHVSIVDGKLRITGYQAVNSIMLSNKKHGGPIRNMLIDVDIELIGGMDDVNWGYYFGVKDMANRYVIRNHARKWKLHGPNGYTLIGPNDETDPVIVHLTTEVNNDHLRTHALYNGESMVPFDLDLPTPVSAGTVGLYSSAYAGHFVDYDNFVLRSVLDGQTFTNAVTPNITVYDTTSATYTATLNGNPYNGETISTSGVYTLIVTAINAAGIQTIETATFTIDIPGPATVVMEGDYYRLQAYNWYTVAPYEKNGTNTYVGAWPRGTGFVKEVLCDFDTSDIEGTVLNARFEFEFSGGNTGYNPIPIELYSQNKGSWADNGSTTPVFTAFKNTEWTEKLGEHTLTFWPTPDPYGWYTITSSALVSEIQSWVDNPQDNNGLVLSAYFGYWEYGIKITGVRLIVEYDTSITSAPPVTNTAAVQKSVLSDEYIDANDTEVSVIVDDNASVVSVEVYDLSGRLVKSLATNVPVSDLSNNKITWLLDTTGGASVDNGIYLIVIRSDAAPVITRKVYIVR